VHALRRIHRSLTIRGSLLDLHPQPKNSRAEVWWEGRVEAVGEWDEEEDIYAVRLARAQLALIENEGLFITERQIEFDLLAHYRSVDDWLDHRIEQDATGVIPKELLDKVHRLLAPAGSELIIREPIRASLLRRLPRD
jgi:hypothetical protein